MGVAGPLCTIAVGVLLRLRWCTQIMRRFRLKKKETNR